MSIVLSVPGASHAPSLRVTRKDGARAAYVVAAAALVAAPFLLVGQGIPGSAEARFALPTMHTPAQAERQPAVADSLHPVAFVQGAAPPFKADYGDAASALRAETCLTEAIYYEGALEPERGQRAIAQVVLNRVRHPAYPDNVCGVVFQGQERTTGCQFTFTCDGSRARAPVPSLWARANRIAREALGGAVAPEVGLATHYHADYVRPYWSATLDPAGQIGRHLFYRWRGNNGQVSAFTMRYSGREPLIAAYTPPPPGAKPPEPQGSAVPAGPPVSTASETAGPSLAIAAPPQPAPFKARPLRLDNQSGVPPK